MGLFHAGMKYQIRVEMNGTNIIVVYHRYLWNINTRFSKKWIYLKQFNRCTSYKTIFHFNLRVCNNSLLLQTLWDRVVTKVEDVSTCRSEFISITSPIDIRNGMKRKGIVVIKNQTMIRCATKILKKTLDSSPMITSKAMHKLWKFIHLKSNTKLSKRKIMKTTNNSLILYRIREDDTSMEFKSWRCSKWCGDWFGI